MEVIVHGTKGGYKSLKKTERAPSIASDIRNNAVINTIIGNSFYAIAYTNYGFVFSKYKIVIDSLRSYATGFIAFSIILPQNKKLKGEDIKAMLDEMLNHYDTNYITNNKMNRGEISPIVDEDWTFLNEITNRYQELPQLLEFDLKPGEKEAAFILYKDKGDLVEYFSKPYQEEYTHYKQVFLIDKEQNHEDLLKFIKNSGIELKSIDLNNDYFILTNYEPHKNVIIKAGGKQLSTHEKHNVIRTNDLVEVIYKKDDFHKDIHEAGKLLDTSSEIHKYLDISDNQINIKYYAFISEPITKTINIQITDPNGYIIENAEIFYKSNYDREEKAINNQITFKGEDLGKNWTVAAQKGNYNGTSRLIPNNYNDGQTFQISLKEERKKEEIKDRKDIKYNIDAGKHGKKSEICPDFTFSKDVSVFKGYVKPNIGWKFDGIEEIKNWDNNEYAGTLKAQYKRDYKPLIYTASIILPLLIVASLFLFGGPSSDDINQAQSLKDTIEGYTHNIELNLEKLKDYDSKWNNHRPQESKGILNLFKSQSYKISDSVWTNIDIKIKNAIEKRNLINSLSLDELKNREFSLEQKEFEETIKQVDSAGQVLLLDSLDKNSIAKMNLDQIAKSIQNTLGLQTKIIEDITGSDIEDPIVTSVSKNERNQQNQIIKETPISESQSASANKGNALDEAIIIKLKRSDVNVDQLNAWKNDSSIGHKLKQSIELYLEFWEMVTRTNIEEYVSFRSKIDNDEYLKNSALKKFLDEIIKDELNKYSKSRNRIRANNIDQLKGFINESNKN